MPRESTYIRIVAGYIRYFDCERVFSSRINHRRGFQHFRHFGNIVHFCGHGSGEEGLSFEDETGQARLVNADTLAEFFELFADKLECVILNACYSEVQAEAVAEHQAASRSVELARTTYNREKTLWEKKVTAELFVWAVGLVN